ncbi:Coenzyme PQQ synthesis protein D (PqqD) [Paenibacillus sp. 1_12]|uniref:lasso peptide biosynthesis PqqD family chaperone n=1 Tax=Paenibacillus sp. 1_12 TaxID=1566278 RepID=UPI0008E9F8B5|nr:lasso peptide biosynthesis PqqD family chaperone [Paenibacillus sp. 1_12]SFL15894.1 Coenzyme PQQ synthesis protein D (PqqD) [Paenibacillus sp. 1_12]
MYNTQEVTLQDVVKQAEGTVVSEMDGEMVMLSIEKGKYYNLGEIGGKIWELIKEPTAVHKVVHILTTLYEVELSECEAHVISFLDELLKEELVLIRE